MPIIKSEDDLDKLLDACTKEYLRVFQSKVYDTIHDYIEQYYDEYEPKQYERTEQFLNSLVKTNVVKNGNRYECSVYIDIDSLHYKAHKGLEVIDMINRGYHADKSMYKKDLYQVYYDIDSDIGKDFWENSMIKTEEQLAKTLIQCFKSHGISVKAV